MQKLLAGPYAWNNPDTAHMQLTTIREDFDTDEAALLLCARGCPPLLAARVIELLRISSRYDCYLQLAWVKARYHETRRKFLEIGLDFYVDHMIEGGVWKDTPFGERDGA